MERTGKILMLIGLLITVAGLVIWLLGDKLRFPGRLPGDIRIMQENYRIYIPVTSMILVSILLTLILWAIQRWGK